MRYWRPILENDAAQTAVEVVEEIANELPRELNGGDEHDYSLDGGTAGLALFYGYLEKAWPSRGYGEIAERLLDWRTPRGREILHSSARRLATIEKLMTQQLKVCAHATQAAVLRRVVRAPPLPLVEGAVQSWAEVEELLRKVLSQIRRPAFGPSRTSSAP